MKKAIGPVLAWSLFWLGDAVSRCMNTRFTGWIYPIYNKLMCASLDVQDWSGSDGPWTEPRGKDNAD